MKKKFAKRLLSWLMSAALVVSMLPLSAMAAEPGGKVAQVGGDTYSSLDAAIKEASDGDTITVLADASSEGIDLKDKNLTIQGANENIIITFANEGIHAVNSNLTFKDCVVDMKVNKNPGGEGSTANLITTSTLAFDHATVTIMNPSHDEVGESGIYLNNFSNLSIQNGSKVNISGFKDRVSTNPDTGSSGIYADDEDRNYSQSGQYQIKIDNGSNLTITDCGWGGMTVNPCDITVSNQSNLSISDCGQNGGRQGLGCYYGTLTIENNSTVDVSNNGTTNNTYWGMFVKGLKIDGTSTLRANDNKGASDGIDIGGTAVIESGATVEAKNNADSGLRVRSPENEIVDGQTILKWAGDLTIESGANVTLSNNASSGISNSNKLTIKSGANVTTEYNKASGIRNNATGTATIEGNVKIQYNQSSGIYNSGGTIKMTSGSIMYNNADYGGGIRNTSPGKFEVSDEVDIYNNHATNAGDDIYNSSNATLTFTEVGSDWWLDDCGHVITGWYYDNGNARWAVHPADDKNATLDENSIIANEFTSFTNGTATIQTASGYTALKAAHGTTFQDKTSYPGLDKQVQDNDLSGDASWEKDSVGAEAGETVNFKLTSNVPQDLTNYLKPDPVNPPTTVATRSALNSGSYILTFHDIMNSNLTLNPDSVKVTIGNTTLTADSDYALTTTELEDGCTFEIQLDLAVLYENGKIEDTDIQNATDITVTYSAKLSADVTMGTYPNKAWVSYEGGKTEEDIVNVNTYAIDIYKYEQGNETKGLSGAVFALYKADENGEFVEDADHLVNNSITSGANGHIEIGGLDDGTYYLKETQAPSGYVCSDQELGITINEGSTTTKAVSVKFANSLIPHTGGMGTTLFSIVGGALIATAGVVFVISRRRKARA